MIRSNTLNVESRHILKYLQTRGWHVAHFSNGMRQLTKDDGAFEIFINPENDDLSANQEEVFFALRTISDYYEKEVADVVRDVLAHLSDRISSRIPDEYVRNESIEFRIAADYVSGIRSFLSSSATTELTDSRSFQRTLKEAISFVDHCRFGHTFRSSFGFVVESPVEDNITPSLFGIEDALPLGRRVVERIAKGFQYIERASDAGDVSIISQEDSGLSSNMCDALADLLEETQVSNIIFGIDLSKEWESSLSGFAPKIFNVAQKDVAIIRAGARSLKIEEAPIVENIYGRVRSVGTDGDPSNLTDDSSKREIELNWINGDDKLIRVKVLVSPEEYLLALDAHKHGKLVNIQGLLPSSGKTRWLEQPSELRLLEK